MINNEKLGNLIQETQKKEKIISKPKNVFKQVRNKIGPISPASEDIPISRRDDQPSQTPPIRNQSPIYSSVPTTPNSVTSPPPVQERPPIPVSVSTGGLIPKRNMVISELCQTEKEFLEDLKLLFENFIQPLYKGNILSQADSQYLFFNIVDVLECSEAFWAEFNQVKLGDEIQPIGDIFEKLVTKF